jgi:peptidoglycan/LPS O-acetylase OafA/YrhL
MIHENELVMLLLSLGVAVFIILKRQRFRQFPGWQLFLAAFLFFAAASVFTVIETFFFNNFFNYMEHFCYFMNGLTILIWCFRAVNVKGDRNE